MANSDKNIIITPNIGQAGQPSFSFIGAGNSSITLKALDDSLGTLSFQNSGSGQVFGLDTNITGLSRNGHNYVESACYTITGSSRNTIVNNNDGYAQFELANDPAYFCTNPNVMQIVDSGNFGLRFTKPGIVHVGVSQDFIATGGSGYSSIYFYVSGSLKQASLTQNTGGQWDGYNAYQIMRVNANDVVQLRFLNADFTAIDTGSWSYYTFLFFALPI